MFNDVLKNISTYRYIKLSKYRERKKYSDKRRKKIYQSVSLTTEQKEKIDALYKHHYGRKIPYIWHQHFTAFTGNFDENYIPELLYIPEFERFMNYEAPFVRVFTNKNIIPYVATAAGIKTPKVYYKKIADIYEDSYGNIVDEDCIIENLKNAGELFIKPSVDSSSGSRCYLMNLQDGFDKISRKNIKDIINIYAKDFVIQERIRCEKTIANIYPNAVNTFRVITYRWKDRIEVCPVIMRIGRGGSNVDNAHAGGMFIAINDDGKLHDTAFTEFNDRFSTHPDTGVVFSDYKINGFERVIDAAKKMHAYLPQIGVFNWDFTIDENTNPVLIEANINGGSIWLIQMAHGKGVFGNNTKEVLKWIGFMEKIPASMWSKYSYGKMKEK